MADSNSEDEVAPRPTRRQRQVPAAAQVEAPADDEPVNAPAEPRGRRQRKAPVAAPAEAQEEAPVEAPVEARGRRQRKATVAAPAEVPAEAQEEAAAEAPVEEEAAEAPSGPRRSARKPAKSAATKRRNLRESRRILAESGFNAENNREGVEERVEGEAEAGEEEVEGGEGEEGQEGQAEEGEMGPLGMIGAMLKGTVNYLKTDPYEQAFSTNITEEPYPSLKELYETAKENPNSAETLRQVTSDFRALKQSYHDEGCDTDINVSMNPRCIGVQAGLYMRLFDIRKSIDDSLEQMRPIQQQAVLARINREARPEYNGEENVFVPAGV
jgi:hypothetical protein